MQAYSSRVRIYSHPVNQGKGAAIRTGLLHSRGDFILIQDADLEYNPSDYSRLLKPITASSARVVYGSRLAELKFRLFGPDKTPLPIHFLSNKFLTWLTNFLYGQSVTDMETGYKVIYRPLMLSLALSANRFDFEPEITAKLLKRGVRIYEVPIKVTPRTYAQGKKIGWKDGISAIWTLTKYRFRD